MTPTDWGMFATGWFCGSVVSFIVSEIFRKRS